MYSEGYGESWALVVGINAYQRAAPLLFARNDAEALAAVLRTRFGFKNENVRVLLDDEASREAIMREYLAFAKDPIAVDDRIVVFFAGHGVTRTGQRGEVGFLLPVDGDAGELETMIRWDDLTRNAEFIPAKHVLFLMDACYGGLALKRAAPTGTARFVEDMLLRMARQVMTAGKADEPVADAGGPRPGHSIFTGHLLNALEGEADSPEGLLTANRLMAHVYHRVAEDAESQQTPHYGSIDGDGDLIFNQGADPPDMAIAADDNLEPSDTEFWSLPPSTPTVSILDPPPATVISSNSTLTFTIRGNAIAANGLSSVVVSARDDVDGMCIFKGPLLPQGSGPGQILQNSIDVTGQAIGFSVDLTLVNPGHKSVQSVCFFVEAVEGGPYANAEVASAGTQITWEP